MLFLIQEIQNLTKYIFISLHNRQRIFPSKVIAIFLLFFVILSSFSRNFFPLLKPKIQAYNRENLHVNQNQSRLLIVNYGYNNNNNCFRIPFLNLKLMQVIEPWEVHQFGVSTPHTTHCLADGDVMISTLGNINISLV